MKVILLENINSLGIKGEIKQVSDGYANNFLLPQNKAILATQKNISIYQAQKNKEQASFVQRQDNYQKIANTLDKQSLNFEGKASDKGHLFKGIGPKDIIAEIKSKFNLDINEKWFDKPALLKEAGKYQIKLNLPNKQKISFYININKSA